MIYDLVVVGGGAAGFFAAINTVMFNPGAKIIIVEKSKRVLQKVKISGGGRCNVTNHLADPPVLSKNYPRGERFLVQPFTEFTSTDTVNWFKKHGVALKTEKDGRIFPVSDSSQTIIDCFLNLCAKYQIQILTSTEIKTFNRENNLWNVYAASDLFQSKNLLIATGSSPKFWSELEKNTFALSDPVPSLFTFTTKDKEVLSLQGISVPNGIVSIGNKFKQQGPVLITHWGFSGPAVLKLSSAAARYLSEKEYNFSIKINWVGISSDEVLRSLQTVSTEHQKKNVISHNPLQLPNRLWKYLCSKANIRVYQNWAESGKKTLQKMTQLLCADTYDIIGKSTYKDEFVTAGGVKLEQIDRLTFESRNQKKLFFAGEVLNIDGYTGGFNFQAAWTAGFIVAKSIICEQ